MASSYRIVDGVRYIQFDDAPLDRYRTIVSDLRRGGFPAFAVRFNREGFARIFCRENDIKRVALLEYLRR